jgi:hypothetical protein
MPKLACAKAVNGLSIGFGKLTSFYSQSTVWLNYLINQVFLYAGFWTGFEQGMAGFAQPDNGRLNLFVSDFYTSSPWPITNTNLIKGYSDS